MGCASSRVDDLPIVSLCRERKDFIKAAAYHRYALAASHVSYFRSLEGVGEALRKFDHEEIGIGDSPSNSFFITIPSDSDEGRKKQNSSLSHYQSLDEDSHSDFTPSPETDMSPDRVNSHPIISRTKYSAWDFFTHYGSVDGARNGAGSVSSGTDSMDDEIKEEIMEEVRKGKQKVVEEILSRWDFGEGTSKMIQLKSEKNMGSVEDEEIKSCSESIVSTKRPPLLVQNEFEIASDHGKEVAVGARYGAGSVSSGTDSMDDEIKEEIMEEVRKGKQKVVEEILSRWDFGEGTSKMIQWKSEKNMGSVEDEEIKSCSESFVSTKRPPLLVQNEFEIASDHGKEVAVMLEVWKSHHPKNTLRVIPSRILQLISPSTLTSSHLVSRQSQRAVESIMKIAMDKYGYSADFQEKSGNLSSTLDKLYAWEEKLYKAVKNEESFRIIYEKKFKSLESLIAEGAEAHKIDASWASTRKWLAKIDIATKTAEVIARRIHKIRDEELEPQITKLIEGLTRMWKSMLKCHEKQFQVIIESISRGFLANTSGQRDSSTRATFELEIELLNWCIQFIVMVNTQKAYVKSLNGWLLKWMIYEPEETPEGIVPFSPGRVGAPPVFTICNDWYQVMERFSETEVANTMRAFALSLHQLWESKDVKQRHRLEAENLFKDLEQQLQSLRLEEIRTHSYGSI